jgi:hypothetical protein
MESELDKRLYTMEGILSTGARSLAHIAQCMEEQAEILRKLRPAPAPPEERRVVVVVGWSQLPPGEWEWCPDHREWIDGKWIKPQKGSLVVSESWDRVIIIDRLDTYDAHALTLGTPILPEEAVEGDYFRGPREQDFTDWRIANVYALNVRNQFAWLRPHAPTEPADLPTTPGRNGAGGFLVPDGVGGWMREGTHHATTAGANADPLPLPYQAEAIARGEMAERLRVAEAEVERLRAGIRDALQDDLSAFLGMRLSALLEVTP